MAADVKTTALDALSVALEQHAGVDLDDVRAWKRPRPVTLKGEALEEACKAVQHDAAEHLRKQEGMSYSDALEAVHEALTARSASGLRGKAVDLGALMRTGIPEVEFLTGDLARRLVYKTGVTGFSGHPESGKTTLTCRLALDAMRAGEHVVYLDYENGEGDALRRLAALGATPDLLTERLLYVPFPGRPDWADLASVVTEFGSSVIVWDSTRGILRNLELDEDRASEVGQFMDPLVEFSVSNNVASLLIDHMTKAGNASSGYSRGSGDKLAAVQGQWYVDRTIPFSETEAGEIELTRWKARHGFLSRTHRFAVGDGEGNLTFHRLDADESPQGRQEAKIIGYLKGIHPGDASQREVEEGVEGGKATEKRDTLKALAAAEGRPVEAFQSGAYVRYRYLPDLDREPGTFPGSLAI